MSARELKALLQSGGAGGHGTNVTSVDAHCIKSYWGHWQKQSRNKPFDEFKHNSNAVIEHLFNDHSYCSDEWSSGVLS
jgi:hypothetical protein